MTIEDQNVFSFHLNEQLWFKRGQEVEEFMGISLEPDISIQEFEDSVSIRGVIELGGEYFRSSGEGGHDEEEQVLSLRDHASKRTIENVDVHEDGVSEFYHRFPVEISIPKSRIQSMDDVTVSIDSFDYELPEKGQLRLNATVAIHGVSEEAEEQSRVAEYVRNQDHLPEPFEFDMTYQEETDEEHRAEIVEDEEEVVEPYVVAEEDEEQAAELIEDEGGGRWKYKKSQSLSEFFGNTKQVEETVEESSSYEYDEESSSEESRDEEDEAPQDARYLTSMFDRQDESFAKMRMCIVQEDDTLGSIAHKYKIPPTHLSRVNNLGDDDVSAGQILYIPAKV